MYVGRNEKNVKITIDGQNIEQTATFKYLGVEINNQGSEEQ